MAPLAYFLGLGSGFIAGAFALLLCQLWQGERAERLRHEDYARRAERCRVMAERSLAVRAARARLGRSDPQGLGPQGSEPGSWGMGPYGRSIFDDLFDDDEPWRG